MQRTTGLTALTFGAVLGVSSPVFAIDTVSVDKKAEGMGEDDARMREGRRSFTPYGFRKFCESEREHCKLFRKSRSKIDQIMKLTPDREAELDEINKTVNSTIRAVPEFGLFSLKYKDEWKLPTDSGDCEDFALLKQKQLIEKGWPKNALLITVADLPGGDRHAVLTVRTDRGDFILDNVTDEVLNWRSVDYRWIKRQSARNMMRWVKIENIA